MPINWINTSASGNHTLCFSRISHHESGSSSAFVDCSLVVRNDTTWHVHVRGHPLPPSSLILADFGSHLDSVTASMLLARLSDLHTCPGNPEPKFVSLANAKRNREFLSSNNEVVAYADAHGSVSAKGTCYPCTVRTTECHLLTKELRCDQCKGYRKNLLAQHSRAQQAVDQPEHTSNRVNYR